MTCSLAEWMTGIGIALVVILSVDGLFRYSRFLKQLRGKHPLKWQNLGMPELVTIEGSQTDRATSVFLLKAYYRDLNDPELTRMGDRMRLLGFINFGVALTVIFALANRLDGNLGRLACFV